MNNIFTLLSIVFLIFGVFSYRKSRKSTIEIVVFFIITFSSLILLIVYGVANYFTGKGIDEATIYHLIYGLEGAGFLEYKLVISMAILVFLVVFFLLFWIVSNKKINNSLFYNVVPFILLIFSIGFNPASSNIYNNIFKKILLSEGEVDKEIKNDFNKYYRKPHIKSLGDNKKNIVFIYAESFERTYFDQDIFPNLIKNLREIESKSIYFTNIKQVYRTEWTVAGMTASQCGIPLITPSHGNSMSGMDQFLPSAVCLGDLLNDNGYKLEYMGGADLNFAGKGKLYKTHGFAEVLGRDELLPKVEDETYKTGWGLYDDSLFNMLFDRFIELSKSDRKFGLFTVTLDTHHPYGHPSKSCQGKEYADSSNPILNAVACSDYLIADFIRKVSESPYANQTIIVLASDHLAMKNTASELLEKKERTNLFMIFDPGRNESREVNTLGSTLDIAPTILPFLGYSGDIGLGRNLLNDKELEEDRLFIQNYLYKWHPLMVRFWDFPKIKGYLKIDINNKVISIDGRMFKMPIFIELDDALQSTFKFEFDRSDEAHKTLITYAKEIDENKYFILIDECKNARHLDNTLEEDGFCLLAGQRNKYTKIVKIDKNIAYTAREIWQFLRRRELRL